MNQPNNSDQITARIIPCLDIRSGRVVKGVNFVGLQDAGDPVEVAKRYCNEGASELAILDITATTEGREHILPILQAISAQTSMPLIVGGGIRTLENIKSLLNAGASKVTISSAAISNPELIRQAAQQFGSDKVVVAIDAKRISGDLPTAKWEVVSHGGTQLTGLDAIEWAKKMASYGAGEILLTSMDRDGTKEGFDLNLTSAVANAINIPVIASGGVGSLQHLADGITKGKAGAVLAASIFHFGQYSITEAKQFLHKQGIKTA